MILLKTTKLYTSEHDRLPIFSIKNV